MKGIATAIALLLGFLGAQSQIKLVDNDASANIPANGPSYIIVSDDETKLTYRGNGTDFFTVDLSDFSNTKVSINDLNEVQRLGNVVFGRGKVDADDEVDLIIATTDGVYLEDYYSTGQNYPMMFGQTSTGAYFGSGKFDPETAGRDFIRVSPDLQTITRPFNNVPDGGVDLIAKNKYKIQMVPFGTGKLLVKAQRTSSDEEYFVWDDVNSTLTQITDTDNSDTDANYNVEWPLAAAMGSDKVVFFYDDALYVSDGTAGGTAQIGSATNLLSDGLGAGDDYFLYSSFTGGETELYFYELGGSVQEIDLNASGSSTPVDFVSNGTLVMFIADDGSGYEPYISDGTVGGTQKLIDINASGASMVPSGGYDSDDVLQNGYNRNGIMLVGNNFVFGATDGTNESIYFTDGTNVVALNNGDEYDGQFRNQNYAMYATEDYLYFTDNDKDVFKVALPDNLYISSAWTNGNPAANQTLYLTEDYTLSSDLTLHSIHLAEGATLTIPDGVTVTVTNDIYRSENVDIEAGGTLEWKGNISLIDLGPAISNVETFLESAESGTYAGQYPEAAIQALEDKLAEAQVVFDDEDKTQTSVDEATDNLLQQFIDTRWERVEVEYNPKNDLVDVIGDVKQIFIRDLPETEQEMELILLSYRDLGCNGLRIDIFGKDPDGNDLNPTPELQKYLYEQALERGFKVYANPAEWGGARRIANQISGQTSDDPGDPVNGDATKTQRLIDRIIEFANEYDELEWISPFNEDGDGTGSAAWSTSQINTIYSSVAADLPSNIKLIGPDTWGLPAGQTVVDDTDIEDYISVLSMHNLSKTPEEWPDVIAMGADIGVPVWDSEANLGADDGEPNRLNAAVTNGVDGVVLYNLWNDATDGFPFFNHTDNTPNWVNEYLDATVAVDGETEMAVGSDQTLWSAVYPVILEETVDWSSSDESIATVSASGVVSALKAGTVTITATASSNADASTDFEIVIVQKVTGITVEGEDEMVIDSDQTLTVTVTPEDAADATVTWSSSDEDVATVDTEGNVEAIALGEVTITATANDGSGVTGTLDIEVTPALVTSIAFTGNSTMIIDYTQTLELTVEPDSATDKSYTLASSDEDIATVDQDGLVEAIAEGTVTITATASDDSGVTGSFEIEVIPALVTEISISGVTAMVPDDTQTLTVTVEPDTATTRTYTLSSSDESIATVDQDGLVEAIALGTVTITATADDDSEVTGSLEISIVESITFVTSIDISGNSTMDDGTSQTLTATVSPENATESSVGWSSNDETIATVDENGEVTAVNVGTVTITATASDGSEVTADFSIEITEVLVTSIEVSGETEMSDGGTQTLSVTILPANASDQSVAWSTSDETLATVSESGEISAHSPGTVTITATANDGSEVMGTLEVEVSAVLVSQIAINGESSMDVGDSQTLTASVSPEDATDGSVIWTTSDDALATVDESGLVTALAEGTVTITATAEDGSNVTGTLEIEISAVLVSEITIEGDNSMNIGETQTVVASVLPDNATDGSVTWSSGDESLATINDDGLVTAIEEGTVTITAKATDGSQVSSTFDIKINKVEVSEIGISGNTEMIIGESQVLTATVLPENATNTAIEWSSDDANIATVDSEGKVEAVALGNATITAEATDGSGVSATMVITVNPELVSGISVSGSSELRIGESDTYTATITPETATDQSVSWASDNTEVLTIDASTGLAEGIAEGTATVTATANDGSTITGSLVVTVSKVGVESIAVAGESIMTVGDTQTLTATILPENATNQSYTWLSSDEATATIDEDGLVTAISTGTVTISAASIDNTEISGSLEITISAPALASSSLHPLKIYPNPSTGVFRVSGLGSESSYAIFNSVGQLIQKGSVSNMGQINMEKIEPGIFLLILQSNTETIKKKLIIK